MSRPSDQVARPFFIVGCGRSGTTLLREMLNAHPRLGIPPECPFLIDYLRAPQLVADKAARLLAREPFVRDWNLGITEEDLAGCSTVPEVIGRFHSLYLERTHGTRWGQKTPKFVRHLPLLSRAFEDAQFIHLVRDGRAVATSYLRATWGPTNLIAAAHYWRRNVLLGLRFAKSAPGRCLVVRYEDLVADPASEISRVLAFLDEPFDDRVVRYHEHSSCVLPAVTRKQFSLLGKPITRNRAMDWKRRLSEKRIVAFESVAGPLLHRLGYERVCPQASRVSRCSSRLWLTLDKIGRMLNHMRTSTRMPLHYAFELQRLMALRIVPSVFADVPWAPTGRIEKSQ